MKKTNADKENAVSHYQLMSATPNSIFFKLKNDPTARFHKNVNKITLQNTCTYIS